MWDRIYPLRIPAVVGTAVAACFPKCPFCVSALLAAAGISISPSPTLSLVVPALALALPLAWIVIRPHSKRVAVPVALGIGLLAGHRVGIFAGWAGWTGAAAMAIALVGSIGLDRNSGKHSCKEVSSER